MNKLLFLMVVIGFSVTTSAQKIVSGKILDKETHNPLPGVNINIKGSDKGVASDFDGNYTIRNIDNNNVLVFSFMGFKTLEMPVGDQSVINVSMEPDQEKLDEVVVTALNIQRDKASLGYSISQVDAAEVNIVKDNNVMNSLTGKVSGLQITQSNTGVDGSSRILLRGVTTISGSNRPLVVVDGIPVSGGSGGTSEWGGTDKGDALSDINPDDVESISVLKGAGASAAYGSLGMNGVILVTTKSGVKKDGIGISLSSTFNTTQVSLTPDLQNEYGTGAFDQFAPIGNDGKPVLDYPFSWSWGPLMEGQPYTNWLGKSDTYSPQGNPYKEFYQTGLSISNSIAFQGVTDKSSLRLSITNQNSQGIVPNNTLKKQTYNFRGSSNLTDDFSIDGKISYIRSKVKNRPELAEGPSNTSLQLSLMPRDVRLEDVKNNTIDTDGNQMQYANDPTFNNPYWSLDNVYNEDVKDRFQGMLSAKYNVNDDLFVTAKSGIDYIITDGVRHTAQGGSLYSTSGLGNYAHNFNKSTIWNSDILGTYKFDLSGIHFNTSLGASYRKEFGSSINVWGHEEKTPDFYRISNYKKTYSNEYTWDKGVYSFYGLGEISYGGFLYFDATIRNDNSSALPKDNNSYWYHSENMSLLFTKLFGINSKTFNLGKIRGSYATVGNDTNPYRTQPVYNIDQTPTLDYTVASIPDALPATNLKPEKSESWEVGTELGFFDNRIFLDATYYETLTTDQIMAVPISGTSAYSSKVINSGSIKNKGFEIQLNLIPVESENFSWDLGLNYTQSKSKVKELNEGLESIVLGGIHNAGVTVEARPGEEFGSIYGKDFLRDKKGRILITDSGYTQSGERKNFGTMNPDFYGGISNNFRYKNLSLKTLISGQKGGVFYSYGRGYRMFFGTDKRSLEGRETGIIVDGINENTGFQNDVPIPAMMKQFSEIFSKQIATDMILDATNVRVKEIVITYDFPQRLLQNSLIQSASISAVGTNLFFIYNAADDIDPEAGFSSGPTGTALELGSLPSTRTYGINFNIHF
ncbi:MAG: SusC/RagA family TonB-linked outer membrane protein [Bacteroidota bacterium]